MHTGPRSPAPADFQVAAASSNVPGLLIDAQLAARKRDQDRTPIMSRVRWTLSRLPNYFDGASAWWGNWVPVATTGWGALFFIAPILLAHFLVWATGARRVE